MRMTLKKGRRDFIRRLIGYAIDGNVLAKCPGHPGSVYRTKRDITDAYAVVEAAWQKGEISSDFESAKSQLDDIIAKAPNRCSQIACWSKHK